MLQCKKNHVMVGPILAIIMSCISIHVSASEFKIDEQLYGTWSKEGSGETLKIQPNGDIEAFLTGQANPFSGNGGLDRCTEGGGNICINGQRMKCAYRASLSQGILNLQFRSGGPDVACKAMSGDFRRRD